MLTVIKAYQASDGTTFDKLEDAQAHEIIELIRNTEPATSHHSDTALMIVAHREKVIDILTTKPSSRTKARAVNGGKKTRKAKENTQTAESGK